MSGWDNLESKIVELEWVHFFAIQTSEVTLCNVIVSYTEDCVNKRIVTAIAHSQPMTGKKYWLDEIWTERENWQNQVKKIVSIVVEFIIFGTPPSRKLNNSRKNWPKKGNLFSKFMIFFEWKFIFKKFQKIGPFF